jgi:cell division transport system permease protein
VRTKLFFTEALRSVTSNLSTTVAATMTVLIGMFLLGLFIALGTWVLSWTNNVKDELQVKIYFDQEATKKEKKAVQQDLIANPLVREGGVVYVSKADALARMKEKYPDLVKELTSNPLPDSYEVRPKRAEDVERLAAQFDPPPAGVDQVSYGKKASERILQVAKIIGAVFLIGSLILLTASVILIANTIRLSIFSRRREVEVMKLVGASNWFVRGPFMLEGIICGLVGSIVAVILLLVAKEAALPSILGRIDEGPSDVNALSFPLIALILIAVSFFVGALGSGVTLRRFLRI